jgi:hypothetical protein
MHCIQGARCLPRGFARNTSIRSHSLPIVPCPISGALLHEDGRVTSSPYTRASSASRPAALVRTSPFPPFPPGSPEAAASGTITLPRFLVTLLVSFALCGARHSASGVLIVYWRVCVVSGVSNEDGRVRGHDGFLPATSSGQPSQPSGRGGLGGVVRCADELSEADLSAVGPEEHESSPQPPGGVSRLARSRGERARGRPAGGLPTLPASQDVC